MNDSNFIASFLQNLSSRITTNDPLVKDLNKITTILNKCSVSGNKVIIAGNGASSSIASHVSIDLTKSAGITCMNFNEPNLITCFANDYGYSRWVEKAISAYGKSGDVFIAVSSSGQSENILNGCRSAREMNFSSVITLSGFKEDNPLRALGDVNLWVNSGIYNIVENVHQIWLLAVVELIVYQKGLKS